MSRIEAVSRRRRAATNTESEPMQIGEIEIRPDQFQAYIDGESVELTRREFELLYLFAEESGHVLQRETIYRRVWGYSMPDGDRSVNVFVRKLRQKLAGISGQPAYIHTHFGIGYRFDPPSAGTPPVEVSASTEPIGAAKRLLSTAR